VPKCTSVAKIKDCSTNPAQVYGPEKGLASLAGGWEGSEDLAERTEELQRIHRSPRLEDTILSTGEIMKTAKEDARQLIESLPDNATWDDLMYEFYVRQKIDAGIQAADEGRVVPHEEVKKRFLAR
jgi:predicted transcriptional regulator